MGQHATAHALKANVRRHAGHTRGAKRRDEREALFGNLAEPTLLVALRPCQKRAERAAEQVALAATALQAAFDVGNGDFVRGRDAVDAALFEDRDTTKCLAQELSRLVGVLSVDVLRKLHAYHRVAQAAKLDHIGGQHSALVALHSLGVVLHKPEPISVYHKVKIGGTRLLDGHAREVLELRVAPEARADDEAVQALKGAAERLAHHFDILFWVEQRLHNQVWRVRLERGRRLGRTDRKGHVAPQAHARYGGIERRAGVFAGATEDSNASGLPLVELGEQRRNDGLSLLEQRTLSHRGGGGTGGPCARLSQRRTFVPPMTTLASTLFAPRTGFDPQALAVELPASSGTPARFTFAQLESMVKHVQSQLAALNFASGTTVSSSLINNAEFVAVFLATAEQG